MRPNFIGIGVPKAGTSWLHQLLDSHPQIWVPKRRKEVRYFTLNYHRGLAWYERFFPSQAEGQAYTALGEISPTYMFFDHARQRMVELGSVEKLIVILRNPVERAYSHYKFRVGIGNFQGTFDDYVEKNPETIDWGYYHRHLQMWRTSFDRDQILVLIYEEAVKDIEGTKAQLAAFLGVEAAAFPKGEGERRVNPSYVPRFKAAYAKVRRLSAWMRKRDMDGLVNLAIRFGVKGAFGKSGSQEIRTPLTPALRERLMALYEPDIRALEADLGRSLNLWRAGTRSNGDRGASPRAPGLSHRSPECAAEKEQGAM